MRKGAMSVKSDGKQISVKRGGHSRYRRYGVLILAAALIAGSLSGCGGVHSEQEKDSPDQTLPPSSDQTSLKPGLQKQTPDIPYSDQIDTIIKNKDIWCFVMPDDAGEEFGYNESDYYYWITDMDQNGYLEVIRSSTTGNGGYFYNDYYEVSPDGKSLKKLATDEREDAPAPDLWNDVETGYYDRKTGTYHYPQPDHTHSSAIDVSDAELDVVLEDGKVNVDTIYYVESNSYGSPEKKNYGCVTEYYAGAKVEKLGEVKAQYDEEKEDFIDTTDQHSEYYKKLAQLWEQHYEGMQEFIVTSFRFRSIDEDKYDKSMDIAAVSDKTLRKRVEESWERFGIYVPNEKVPANPFFPETAAGDAEVRYLLELLSGGKATMQIQEEVRGNEGVLYQVTYCDPREVSNQEVPVFSEEGFSEEDEKEYVEKTFQEFYFYLWVTDTEIYYIPRFYSYRESDEEDVYQKIRLAFHGVLPEYALLVCQEEEMEDRLKETEVGEHQWIEKHGEDIRCYRSYTSKGEGYEGINILQFVWKRGEGLIGVRYATHAAGGGSRLFWKEDCLEQEDVGFSID